MVNKRKEQAKATKQKILDASQKLFGEKGFLNTTIDDIALECGIGRGTLYHYFSGKDAIFSYIERGRFQEMHEFVEEMDCQNVFDKLSNFISKWFECVDSDNLNVSKDWHRLSVELKVPSSEKRTHLDDDIDNVSSYLEEAVGNHELSSTLPIKSVAKDIVFSMYGASFYRCSTYNVFDITKWSQDFITDVLELHLATYRL